MGKEELMWMAAWAGGMLGNRQQLVRAHEDKSRALGENSKYYGDLSGEYKARECTLAAEGLKQLLL